MGKIMRLIMQKFMPNTKKSLLVKMRRKNGVWIEKMIPPSKPNFKLKGGQEIYYLRGTPDIEDFTGQRSFTFLEGIPDPVHFSIEHPKLMVIGEEAKDHQTDLQMQEEIGFQKAMLIKGKKDMNFMLLILLIVGINIIVSIAGFYMILDKLGVRIV